MSSIERRPVQPSSTTFTSARSTPPQVCTPTNPTGQTFVGNQPRFEAARPRPGTSSSSGNPHEALTAIATQVGRAERGANAAASLTEAAQIHTGNPRLGGGVPGRVSNGLGVAAAVGNTYRLATGDYSGEHGTRDLADNALGATGSILTATANGAQARAAVAGERAANTALQGLARRTPNRAGAAVVRQATPEVAQLAGTVASRGGAQAAERATVAAGRSLARQGVTSTANVVARTPAVAGRAAATAAGKAGGRFVPGLNVAIAAVDTAQFAADMADPRATRGRRVMSGLTAAASVVSATNIPVVSQVGAGVSALSGLARDLWFGK